MNAAGSAAQLPCTTMYIILIVVFKEIFKKSKIKADFKLKSKDKADFKLNSRVKVILALTAVTGGSMENCEVTPARLLYVSICNTKQML